MTLIWAKLSEQGEKEADYILVKELKKRQLSPKE